MRWTLELMEFLARNGTFCVLLGMRGGEIGWEQGDGGEAQVYKGSYRMNLGVHYKDSVDLSRFGLSLSRAPATAIHVGHFM